MNATSAPLLIVAAGVLGFLHSILPDHWVPLAVVARTRRWSLLHTARISLLASVGHVATSIILAGIIAAVGLQFRQTFEAQQSHVVGVILVLTGLGFLLWALTGRGHGHSHSHGHGHGGADHHHDHDHEHPQDDYQAGHDGGAHPIESGSAMGRLAAIVVPFGAAASPDLTVLPVALAASAISIAAVAGVLVSFTLVTLGTFVIMTVAATIAGYQVKGEWLEEHGNAITGFILTLVGVAVFLQIF